MRADKKSLIRTLTLIVFVIGSCFLYKAMRRSSEPTDLTDLTARVQELEKQIALIQDRETTTNKILMIHNSTQQSIISGCENLQYRIDRLEVKSWRKN